MIAKRSSRTLALSAGALALALAVGPQAARADIGDVDPLVACSDGSSADIGDAKFSPGLQTTEKKNTITATFSVNGCVADEADLDEIAAESKFGVSKTIAGGRPNPLAKGTAKGKFTSYGDCLGIVIPDPDSTGEYPAVHGTLQVQWLTAADVKIAKTAAFVVLDAGVGAILDGLVTKGLGVGGALNATAGFLPVATDDDNGNMSPDFIDCALLADPTAKAKLLDVASPATLDITL